MSYIDALRLDHSGSGYLVKMDNAIVGAIAIREPGTHDTPYRTLMADATNLGAYTTLPEALQAIADELQDRAEAPERARRLAQ